ncbi:unnamed protein product [Orchesella dallaii]|uniref:Uncharacterized protein n=1 Tax=Orchesella dallaii TaxID=48710 RepID=A0ABP1RQC7_9HEXA
MIAPENSIADDNKSTASFSFPLWMTFMFLFAFSTLGDCYNLQNSVPLLWRRGTTPVTSGHYQVNLLVKFVSPCSMLRNGTVHQDLTDVAFNKCEEIYNELFLDEQEIMCPKSNWSVVLDRQRRAIFGRFILGIIAVVQVVAAGLCVACFAVSISNANTMAEMKHIQTQPKHMMKEMEWTFMLSTISSVCVIIALMIIILIGGCYMFKASKKVSVVAVPTNVGTNGVTVEMSQV